MNAVEKHLELIQGAVNRLAANSYAYKGWSVTLAAGLIAFLASSKPSMLLAALYPIFAFWFLDASNLALERSFRCLYDKARIGEVKDYSMSLVGIKRPFLDQLSAGLSSTLIIFYGSEILFVLIVGQGYKR